MSSPISAYRARWRLALLATLLFACDSSGQALAQRPQLTPCAYADPRHCTLDPNVPLFNVDGHPYVAVRAATNPIPSGASAFCLSTHLTAQRDWNENTSFAPIGIGSVSSNINTIDVYRFSNTSNSNFNTLILDGSGNMAQCQSTTGMVWPVGQTYEAQIHVAICIDGGSAKWYLDGSLTSTCSLSGLALPLRLPGTMNLTENAQAGFAYGDGVTNLCIAGPTGRSTGDPVSDIGNACGQFTAFSDPPCYGCVIPNGNASQVAAFGDSITSHSSSTGAFRPWPAQLNTRLGVTYNIQNLAVSGSRLAAMKTAYEGTARNWSRCLLLGGVNNIFGDSESAATAFAVASALLDEMRSDGCRPIVVLPTPIKNIAGWTSGKQTEYDALRADYVAYCGTNSATTTCVDTYGDGPSLGLGDGTSPPALYSPFRIDGIHPNQDGQTELGNLVFAGSAWP